MLTLDEIKDYFLLVNSHAKKELGQNFLLDEEVSKRIRDELELKEDDNLLEIGPGLGSLTSSLVNITNSFVAVEYDEKFVTFLNKNFENSNLKVIKNNILKFKDFNFNKVCGNLPYYISTDILEYLISNFLNMEIGVFMVQKEFFERITTLNNKDKGPLNYLIEYQYNIKKIIDVKKGSFFPVPQVDSIVFKLLKKDSDDQTFNKLKKILNISFMNRRKTLINNLKGIIKDKTKLSDVLISMKLNINVRPEELTLNDFLNLLNRLLKVENLKL